MKRNLFFSSFSWTILLKIVLIFLISLPTVQAQNIYDDYNCVCAVCGKACSQVNISGHKPGYSCYTSGSTTSSSSSSSVVNTSSPITMALGIGAVGAVTGLLFDSKNGKDYSLAGGFGGFGLGVAIGLGNSAKERSVGENLVYSIIGGASVGLGVAEMEKANTDVGTTPKDNTVERLVEGAALGILADGLFTGFKKKTKGGYSLSNKKTSMLSNMYITMYSNRIGLRASF